MKNILALVLVGLAIMVAAPAHQSATGQGGYGGDRDVWETINEMDLRLEKLEALAAMESPTYFEQVASPPPSRAQRPRRLMIFDAVETIEPDPDAKEELKRLQKEADAFQRTVDQMERSVVASASNRSYRGRRAGPSQRRDKGELLGDYKRKLGQKRGEVRRLERSINEPKQLIIGHWEGKIITLHASKDLTPTLNKLDPGDQLSWEGRRVREDKDSQEWVITRIEAVGRGF